MDKPDLLAEFQKQLEAYERYQSFIDKARSMTDKFRPEVVEKVVTDNTAKMREVSDVLAPLVPEVQAIVAELRERRGGIEGGMEAERLGLEELELRQMIGELDDEGFEAQASELRSAVEAHGESLSAIDEELASFTGLMDAWEQVQPSDVASSDDDLLGDLDDEPAPAVVEPSEDDAAFEVEADEPESTVFEPMAAEVEEDEGLFGDAGDSQAAFAVSAEDEAAFGDVGGRGSNVQVILKPGVTDDVSAVFDDDLGGGSSGAFLTPNEPSEDDANLAFEGDDISDIGEELPSADAAEEEGQAVLIVGEGTDEEHVYPFTGEVISLGRGKDNTIQVKNDSKVSRYHCKLFKRDGNFFVEDNKSANGTLVDGELITEKRLLGGEQVIIGETFFRFRIGA